MTADNQQDALKQLLATGHSTIGLSQPASSVLINNLNNTVAPMCIGGPLTAGEEETDDFRLVFLVFDGSSSMMVVEDDLRECVNEVLIPGILGGAAEQVGAIRYNGVVFNHQISPLWASNAGWKGLKDETLSLTDQEYRAYGSTALHQAVLDAITATTAYAIQLAQKTGSYPRCTIAVLSDGANNQPPLDAAAVKTAISGLSGELFDLLFLGFETGEPVDFRAIAREMGFSPDQIQDSRPVAGESREQMRRRLRHAMQIFSASITGSVSRSQVGNSGQSSSHQMPGQGSSSGGLWTP